ncbi:hypothetical protein NEIFLAOT_02066 [Neisseria flavescens NRL30031/H210]|uniref:Uncharacterized protein n=1 Tax=Neisseria flavescens NRL30031/H210 TaxID=546264 RepID=C0EQ24_NEIFL|nr:hypothetical protein NEIFLAOT_02066 [Neisseria flavescens NRL30031/H210]
MTGHYEFSYILDRLRLQTACDTYQSLLWKPYITVNLRIYKTLKSIFLQKD